jgi:hypothetical protein
VLGKRAVLYLFDANVLVTASNMYYELEAVPEFWEWIDYHAINGRIKLPVEVPWTRFSRAVGGIACRSCL